MCTNILECTHNHQEFMVQINEQLTNFFLFEKKKKKKGGVLHILQVLLH